ncbi:protein-L-isoaspartate(D-aspartate) O-methyltransferase [archaeon]|nr:MAG: protein-L-isoaspartate(D-aspartate) O-methyltransferase [archaeon]
MSGDLDMTNLRRQMVLKQISNRGISDPKVLHAMATVPRHLFVPFEYANDAYKDHPMPIGFGQTISQPYIVAYMAECAKVVSTDKVLDVGTGSGYAAAVLSHLTRTVHTVEVVKQLHLEAKGTLERLGYHNVVCHFGDGSQGLASEAPFDAIIVAAGAPEVPKSLVDQLRVGGRLVIPVTSGVFGEDLMRITKMEGGEVKREHLGAVAFVPLLGKEGWKA